jgi:hypothetical protein
MFSRSDIRYLCAVPLGFGLILIGISVASEDHAFIKLGAMIGGPLIVLGLIGLALASHLPADRNGVH